MQLSNDLITTLTHYTTTATTLNIVTIDTDIARNTYTQRAYLWRQKTIVETRNMIPKHLEDSSISAWYYYYMKRKRNIYGHIYDPDGQCNFPAKLKIYMDKIFIFLTASDNIIIGQLIDYTIIIIANNNIQTMKHNRRIVQAAR